MGTARFRTMRSNLAALRRELLPRSFDATGNYPDRQRSRAAAYRLLAHAEFESFLEDRAMETAISATARWRSTRRTCPALVGLLAFCERAVESAPPSISPPQANQAGNWAKRLELDERVNASMTIYASTVRNNHGIKEANVLGLLLPLGFPTNKLDQTWLASMDSFGSTRGAVAHRSIVRINVDPRGEFATVLGLVAPLANIDSELQTLL